MRRHTEAARLVAVLIATSCAGCAAPLYRVAHSPGPADRPATHEPGVGPARPTIGVALGGGSARGIAHVGVIKWLEAHRIPVDVCAGTSMGGLVGGAFASGMDGPELQAFIEAVDWDQLFGASTFDNKNVRRKADSRSYPSRLEFGLRGGIVAPNALNDGEYVELLLARIAAPYHGIATFDDLPTPFRTVAVDLLSAQQVIMGEGSLADAMRATMSLPLIFPPTEVHGRMLVDGGTMNNVPADVVRAMGADQVIAVNVGDLSERDAIANTMFGVAGSTLDAMMRASTRRALASATVLIDVPLGGFGSLDWRRARELVHAGYAAAEAQRSRLLPFALSEGEYAAWRRERQKRRRSTLPVPAFVQLDGFADNDARRLETLLAEHVGKPLAIDLLERHIAEITGLDRYQTVTWAMVQDPVGTIGLRVRARVKPYAPPFLMLGVNLENTTSSDFRITTTGRYLAFDTVGSGSELRLDGTIGSNPGAGAELYRPLGGSPVFAAARAGIGTTTLDVIDGDAVTARYKQTVSHTGLELGVNLGARSDVRVGGYVGRSSASIEVGDPGLPELRGKTVTGELAWRLDTQDSPVVPGRGVFTQVRLAHVFDGPDVQLGDRIMELDGSLTQLSAAAHRFWSLAPRDRVFVYGGVGTSFDGRPLPTREFVLGTPFRLGAYDTGELRGAHYYVATAGYLRRVGRLPDFVGGPIFAGAWVENGDAFDRWAEARVRTNAGAGLVMDTLVGPVLMAASWSLDGRWRTFLGIGRTFR